MRFSVQLSGASVEFEYNECFPLSAMQYVNNLRVMLIFQICFDSRYGWCSAQIHSFVSLKWCVRAHGYDQHSVTHFSSL